MPNILCPETFRRSGDRPLHFTIIKKEEEERYRYARLIVSQINVVFSVWAKRKVFHTRTADSRVGPQQ